MKFIKLTSIFLISTLALASNEEISQTVINGEDAFIEDHPYMGIIYTLFLPTCGSSILNSRSVLTVKISFNNLKKVKK